MRNYISLGSAMLMGAVLGKSARTPLFMNEKKQVIVEKAVPPTVILEKPMLLGTADIAVMKIHQDKRQRKPHQSRSVVTSKTSGGNSGIKDKPAVQRYAQCGENYNVYEGNKFHCWDPSDNQFKQCVGIKDGRYQCWDGEDWEWNNQHEHDGTPDNSKLTSIHTDGQHHSSHSIGVRDSRIINSDTSYNAANSSSMTSKQESINVRMRSGSSFICGTRNHELIKGKTTMCWDPSDQVMKYCQGLKGGIYRCWDGSTWEWANWNEHDGTPDGSNLTSVHTDGVFQTSASIGVKASKSLASSQTSIETPERRNIHEPKVQQILCGGNFLVAHNFWFHCWDATDNQWKTCVGTGAGHYQCWDGQQREWANWYERDGTFDGSWLTSVVTDGRHGTSHSIGVKEAQDSSVESATTFQTAKSRFVEKNPIKKDKQKRKYSRSIHTSADSKLSDNTKRKDHKKKTSHQDHC